MNLVTATPKYYQLAREIAAKIRSGTIPHGARLSGVREMARQYRVSTAVSIAAFKILEDEGLVIKKQGSGTFVNNPAAMGDRVDIHCWNQVLPLQAVQREVSGEVLSASGGAFHPFFTSEYSDYREYIHYIKDLGGSGGNHVVAVDEGFLPVLAENDLLEPLNPAMIESKYIRKAAGGMCYNGTLYAVPISFSPAMLLYNRKIFAHLGVPEPKSAMTWEDFAALAGSLTRIERGDGAVKCYGLGIVYSINAIMPFIWQNNGEMFDRNGSCLLDSEEALTALDFFFNLLHSSGTFTHRYGDERAALAKSLLSGHCAMLIGDGKDYFYLQSHNQPESWGVVALPGRLRQATSMAVKGWAVIKSPSSSNTLKVLEALADRAVAGRLAAAANEFSAVEDENILPPEIRGLIKVADYSLQSPAIDAFDLVNSSLVSPIRHRIRPDIKTLADLRGKLNNAPRKLVF